MDISGYDLPGDRADFSASEIISAARGVHPAKGQCQRLIPLLPAAHDVVAGVS